MNLKQKDPKIPINMIDTLKEEIKNSLKEMKERTNKNWKKTINH